MKLISMQTPPKINSHAESIITEFNPEITFKQKNGFNEIEMNSN